MLTNPFLHELQASRKVLVAGAGGGFDVFSALPLYFSLVAAGKEVHLANLTFSNIHPDAGRRLCPEVVEINADAEGSSQYFPEKHLSAWFAGKAQRVSVWAIERYGPARVAKAYQSLVKELKPDTIVLVDGGTDSLMRGDEFGLGTPVEDVSSIAAVDSLTGIERKYLVCLGFGVDHFHSVCHVDVLEAISELIRSRGYLGAFSLTWDMPEVKLFVDATRYVMEQTSSHPSIVCSSILSAIAGAFGNVHTTSRTDGSELFINPLMAFYWAFRLDAVARRIMYLDRIRSVESFYAAELAIEAFRDSLPARRAYRGIPL